MEGPGIVWTVGPRGARGVDISSWPCTGLIQSLEGLRFNINHIDNIRFIK